MNRTVESSYVERALSIASYFTMGLAGLIWIIAAYLLKKKIKFFLMYNFLQSMLISVCLAALNLALGILFQILDVIPFLDKAGEFINGFLYGNLRIFGLYCSKIQLFVLTVLLYISIGVIFGRILYLPGLSDAMKFIMRSYR